MEEARATLAQKSSLDAKEEMGSNPDCFGEVILSIDNFFGDHFVRFDDVAAQIDHRPWVLG